MNATPELEKALKDLPEAIEGAAEAVKTFVGKDESGKHRTYVLHLEFDCTLGSPPLDLGTHLTDVVGLTVGNTGPLFGKHLEVGPKEGTDFLGGPVSTRHAMSKVRRKKELPVVGNNWFPSNTWRADPVGTATMTGSLRASEPG